MRKNYVTFAVDATNSGREFELLDSGLVHEPMSMEEESMRFIADQNMNSITLSGEEAELARARSSESRRAADWGCGGERYLNGWCENPG